MDLKELRKLIKYLRKEGITEFKQGDLELKLAPLPEKKRKQLPVGQDPVTKEIESDYPSHEELLFMSAGGPPDA